MERLPNRILARIKQQKALVIEGLQNNNVAHPQFVINKTKRWAPGQTIKVAFRGGSKELHEKIASKANIWTSFANLKLDFGKNPATGEYRKWTPQDEQFAANIRISFNWQGYYSLVGTDSDNPSITNPREESMNFSGFDQALPADWESVVLHEFGHAFAFEHEHQHPAGGCDFRWDDDPGYEKKTDQFGQFIPNNNRRPGIYTVLGGPPNSWSKETVDFNLRQLSASSAFMTSTFDVKSIMQYHFDAWMFEKGEQSSCFTQTENGVLSALDKEGARKLYPFAPQDVAVANGERVEAIKSVQAIKSLPSATKLHLQKSLE